MLRPRHLFAPLLAVFAAAGAWRSISSPDAFWHLASGRWMLRHGEIPRHDPFRFTSGGEAWVDHEWGFQLLLGLAERLGGLPALLALRSAIFALLALVLWRLGLCVIECVIERCVAEQNSAEGSTDESGKVPENPEGREWVDLWTAGALGFGLVVGIDGLHGRMPLRPELLTLVFFSALLWILETSRHRPARAWRVLPLIVLWVNVHPGALLAPGIVFLHLVGRRLRPAGGDTRPSWTLGFGLPTLAFGALGCNPWGFDVVALPFRIRAALADLPASNPDWRRIWDDPPIMLLGLVVMLVLLSLRSTAGERRSLDLASALVLLATLGLAVVAVRFQGLLWIAAFVLFARGVGNLRNDSHFVLGERLPRVVLAMLVLGCGVESWRASRVQPGVEPGRFPDAGVTALSRWQEDGGVGHLFHSAVFGGYVLYRSFPPRQIFVDTRNEVDPGILREIAEARSDARAWRRMVERYDLDAALVRYEDRPRQVLGPPATAGGQPTLELHTTSALLFPQSDWALVHWDDVSMLFLRRTQARSQTLAGSEYRFVQPEDVQATLQAARDPAFRRGLLRELERKLAADPESRRARALQSALEPADGGTMP